MVDMPATPPSGGSAGSFRPHGRCTLLATDISGYGRRHARAVQEKIRDQHYRILRICLQEAGIRPEDCYWEDRGDGAIVAIPIVDHDRAVRAIGPFRDELLYRLREHNLGAVKEERIRLRVALHIGEAHHDGRGLVGTDVNLVFRLIGARTFKDRFRESTASLALAISEDLYESVIKSARHIDPDEFEQILVSEKETRTTAWIQLRGKADPRKADDSPADLCPYPGLAPFELEQAPWFYGREQAITELLDRLERQLDKPEPLIVVGASGVGKSSLLRAGLLHRLKSGKLGVAGSSGWTRLLLTPTARPLDELSAKLAEAGLAATGPAGEPEPEPADHSGASPTITDRPVIVIDQFEETFTLCSDERQRHLFIRRLCDLATTGAGGAPALVVLGLRAEFFDRCTAYKELQGALRAPVPLAPMTPDELRDAIKKPADAVGLAVEPGLVDTLLDDLDIREDAGGALRGVHDPGVLPLLAHALRATWLEGDGHGLTLARYQAIGTIRRAIAQTADQVYERLDPAEQQTARRLLLRMINISDDSQIRRRADRTQLVEQSPEPAAAEAVLEELASARLVTLAETTAEIAHDVLLRAWPKLRHWIDADRAGLLVRQRLLEEAENWQREGKDPSGLYRGPRLADARAWAKTAGHDADLSPLAREFLAAATEAEIRERRAADRRTKARRLFVVALGCLSVLLVVATVIAWRGQNTATRQRNEALSSQLAGEADALLQSRSELAVLLSVQAFGIGQTAEARNSLASTQAHYIAARLPTPGPAADVTFSRDGRTIATAACDGVDEWDFASRRHLRTVVRRAAGADADAAVDGCSFYGAAYSPRADVLAVAANDGGVRLWNAGADPPASVRLPGPRDRGPADDVAYSPDGRLLAAAGHDGLVRLWDARTRDRVGELADNPGPVEAVAFSPDGRTLAGVGADSTVVVWDVPSKTLVTRLRGHVGPVRSVAFSPDGRIVAAGGDDGSVRLWDARTHERLGSLIGHLGPVRSVAFSPNGQVLASGGDDASVRLWDVGSRSLLTPLTGPTGAVAKVTFSPDGGALAGANADSSVGFWRIGALGAGRPGPAHAVTVRPDGAPLLATAGTDRAIWLWDVTTGRRVAVVEQGRTGRRAINALAFGRGGRLLAAADDAGVTLWELSPAPGAEPAARRRVARRGAGTDPVTTVAVSPDGQTVAAAGGRTVTLWDLATGRMVTLTPHPSTINVVAFSPDGRTIATGGDDQTVSLTPIRDPSGVIAAGTSTDCSGHLGPVLALAFNPRGDRLASAGTDHTVKLWTLEPCKLLRTFIGHTQSVPAVAFSPDGRRLASAGEDEFINVWDVASNATETNNEVVSLRERSAVTALVFGATSEVVISVGPDGRPIVWDTDPARVRDRICRPVPPLPPDWHQYVPAGVESPCAERSSPSLRPAP